MGLLSFLKRGEELVTESGIHVTLKPEDQPEFRREYKATFNKGFRIEIAMHTSSWGRVDSSYLYQPNGNLIGFDAKAVADRIIDRELLPYVQTLVDEILTLDRAFIASIPAQFVDEKGTTWQRLA